MKLVLFQMVLIYIAIINKIINFRESQALNIL